MYLFIVITITCKRIKLLKKNVFVFITFVK